jgi:hypothetical protein
MQEIEMDGFSALLAENRTILNRLSERYDLTSTQEIDVRSQFCDWDSAMSARTYVKSKHELPSGVLFRVVSRKYRKNDEIVELVFTVEAVPDPETITRLEIMLVDAAHKFGGGLPTWEIGPLR